MTTADLDRLERLALAQLGQPVSTLVRLMPGELLELARLARIGAEMLADPPITTTPTTLEP